MPSLVIDDFQVKLSNLDKVFWPEYGYTKGDLIDYYLAIYPLIKEYLRNRPLSLKIYPDGINGKSFFRKNIPDYAPDWLSTIAIYSNHRRETINWIIINKLSDLSWVANSASIELHGWFSTTEQQEKPDFAVFDLDPGESSTFNDVIRVALLIKQILDELSLKAFIKTSGKTGLHIYIPLQKRYKYKQVKNFLRATAKMVVKLKPELATIEWRKKERAGKVYIDYRQNDHGKTIPVPYSLRPTKEATISTPLNWEEVELDKIKPGDFTLENILQRIDVFGDLWTDIFTVKQELPHFLLNN